MLFRSYAVYDEDRQAFLYIVVSDRENAGLKDLMWNLHLAVELRAGKDMAPFTAQGTVEPMGEEMLEHVFSALGESEVIGLYRDFQEDAVYREAYFGDEHGQVMEEMCRALDQNALQEDWYYLKTGVVNGLEMADIWICILAAGLSLLLAVVRVAGLFTGGRKPAGERALPVSGRMGEFYAVQREWVDAARGHRGQAGSHRRGSVSAGNHDHLRLRGIDGHGRRAPGLYSGGQGQYGGVRADHGRLPDAAGSHLPGADGYLPAVRGTSAADLRRQRQHHRLRPGLYAHLLPWQIGRAHV